MGRCRLALLCLTLGAVLFLCLRLAAPHFHSLPTVVLSHAGNMPSANLNRQAGRNLELADAFRALFIRFLRRRQPLGLALRGGTGC